MALFGVYKLLKTRLQGVTTEISTKGGVMIELIEQTNRIGIGLVVLCFVVSITFIISALTLKNKFMETLDLKSGKALKIAELEEKIQELEYKCLGLEKQIVEAYEEVHSRQKKYHEQSIAIRTEMRAEMKEGQKELNTKFENFAQKFDTFIDDQNEKTVAGFRSSLWRMHRDFVQQGFVTPDGLKTFAEMGKTYEKAGGDDIYHEKLKPEVEALEIHYPDGSIYNKHY